MQYLAHSAKGEAPSQTYKEHVSEVFRMAKENAAGITPYTSTEYAGLLYTVVRHSAAFHDLGKLDADNQRVLLSGKGRLPINHVDAGVAHLLVSPSVPRNIAALSVYSHHIGLPSLPDEAARGQGKAFRDESIMSLTNERLPKYLEIHKSNPGLRVIADDDWSGTAPTPLFMRFALSCLVDADHSDTARHYNNVVSEGKIQLMPDKRLELLDCYVAELGTDHHEKARTSLRNKIYNACRDAKAADAGIIACDSPVGTGKTTAVMAHLLNVAQQRNLRRIFVVLPFTNIIDQSVDIYRKALVRECEIAEKVVAAHHHRAEFSEPETRAFSFLWNAPVTVTTAVQFFETLSSNRPAALRKLHQLPGSAVFMDEAHAALPAHLWPQAWKWLMELVKDWGCYVVMASGSLTRFWEIDEFSSPPISLDELVEEEVRREAQSAESIRIKYKRKAKAFRLSELRDWVQKLPGPRLVILNTVQSAAALADLLAGDGRKDKDKVEHISTALTPIHRNEAIEKIKKRLKDKADADWTLVATSCVEAGMDFSFRTAIRESCSLVSSVQTAGRINRAGEFQESALWDFKIIPGDKLREHPGFRLSSAILEELFDEGKVAPQYCKEAMKREVRRNNQGSCDENPVVKSERNREFPEVENKFKVIEDNTVTVVVDNELMLRIERGEGISPAELQQKSINIYSYQKDRFALKPFDKYPGLYAWTLAYDDFIGYMAGVFEIIRHENRGSII